LVGIILAVMPRKEYRIEQQKLRHDTSEKNNTTHYRQTNAYQAEHSTEQNRTLQYMTEHNNTRNHKSFRKEK